MAASAARRQPRPAEHPTAVRQVPSPRHPTIVPRRPGPGGALIFWLAGERLDVGTAAGKSGSGRARHQLVN
jgi:hypothetical protein